MLKTVKLREFSYVGLGVRGVLKVGGGGLQILIFKAAELQIPPNEG